MVNVLKGGSLASSSSIHFSNTRILSSGNLVFSTFFALRCDQSAPLATRSDEEAWQWQRRGQRDDSGSTPQSCQAPLTSTNLGARPLFDFSAKPRAKPMNLRETRRMQIRVQFVRIAQRVEHIIVLLASLAIVQRGRSLISSLRVNPRLPSSYQNDPLRYFTSAKVLIMEVPLATGTESNRLSMAGLRIMISVEWDPCKNPFTGIVCTIWSVEDHGRGPKPFVVLSIL